MSDTLKKKFIASLEITTKDAEQQIKGASKKIIEQINNIGKASDKVTYFKSLVENITDVENSLHAFKTQFGEDMLNDILGHISPAIDAELKNILGTTKEQLFAVEELYRKKSKIQQSMDVIDNTEQTKVDLPAEDKDQLVFLEKLVAEYNKAADARRGFETRKDTKDNAYKKAVVEQVVAAKRLVSVFDNENLGDNSSTYMSNQLDAYEEAESAISDFYNSEKDMLSKLKSLYASEMQGIEAEIKKIMTVPTGGSGDKGQVDIYDKLISKTEKYLELQKQLQAQMDQEDISDDELDNTEKQIAAIQEEIVVLGELEGKVEEVKKVFAAFNNSEIAEEDLFNELKNTLGVEIPVAAQKAEKALDDLHSVSGGKQIINTDTLKADLEQVHELAFKTQKELSFSVTSDGVKYVVESMEGVTKFSEEAAAAVHSLSGEMSVLSHTHPGGNGFFSVADLRSGLSLKSSGINLPMMALSKVDASVLNLDGVTDDVIQQVRGRLEQLSPGDIVSPKLFTELQNIFKDNGFEGALQKINIKNGPDDLVRYLQAITTNAQEAQTPLEKLQGLISYYSDGKMNANNMSQFGDYWDEFEQGAKSAVEVFDAVMAKLNARDKEGNLIQVGTADYQPLAVAAKNISVGDNQGGLSVQVDDTQVERAEKKLQEFLGIATEAQTLKLDTPDEELGMYLGKLQLIRDELEALGQQGVLTEGQLHDVAQIYGNIEKDMNTRFGESKATREWLSERGDSLEVSNGELTAENGELTRRNEELTQQNSELRQDISDYIEQTDELRAENALLRDQIGKQQVEADEQVQASNVDEDLARENGQLEEKLDLLREIADQYGVNITNAKRNKYEELNQKEMNDGLTSKQEERFSELGEEVSEADANLEEFGATYDKITLKLANGKKVDILPDDKGLRSLYAYSDGYGGDEYKGTEIADVIFQRKQEQEVIRQTNQELQEQIRLQEMNSQAAMQLLEDHIGKNTLKDWYDNQNPEAKKIIEDTIKSNNDLRNAAYNVAWDKYKKQSGTDIGFNEFLYTDIPMYRGKTRRGSFDINDYVSFTPFKEIAEDFGDVVETMIKPIDTLGSASLKSENEFFVSREQIESRPEIQEWLKDLDAKTNAKFEEDAKQVAAFLKGFSEDEVRSVLESRNYGNIDELIAKAKELNGIIDSSQNQPLVDDGQIEASADVITQQQKIESALEDVENQAKETANAIESIGDGGKSVDELRQMYDTLKSAHDALPRRNIEEPDDYKYNWEKAKDYVDFEYDGEDLVPYDLDFQEQLNAEKNLLDKAREAIKLTYKQIRAMQNAVSKHGGHLGDDVYGESDIENAKEGLMGLFEKYHTIGGDLDNLDVKMTKPFQALLEQTKSELAEREVQREAYKAETEEIITNNRKQIESYHELHDATRKAFEASKSKDSKYEYAWTDLPDVYTGYDFNDYNVFEHYGSFETNLKRLGIEVPQAAEKATQAQQELKSEVEQTTNAIQEQINAKERLDNVDTTPDSSIEKETAAIEEQTVAYKQLEDAKEIADKADNIKTIPAADNVSDEINQLEILEQKVKAVIEMVDAKTEAFKTEGSTVESVVKQELTALDTLSTYLDTIRISVNDIVDGLNKFNSTKLNNVDVPSSADATSNPHYVTDPQGNPVFAYRGIRNNYGGTVSNRYHGGTFSTDNLELAKEYAGEFGKVEKIMLSMMNPFEIEGNGANWDQIKYIGHGADEASKKLHELYEQLSEIEDVIRDFERRGLDSDMFGHEQKAGSIWQEINSIYEDPGNPYDIKNTNQWVEFAKNQGYDGVIFKNIIDSFSGNVEDISNVMVTFEADQIHYVETIKASFSNAVNSFKEHFGDLSKYVNMSWEDVDSAVKSLAEGKEGKLSLDDLYTIEGAYGHNSRGAIDYQLSSGDSDGVNDIVIEVGQYIDGMREQLKRIAQAFNMEDVPLDKLLDDDYIKSVESQSTEEIKPKLSDSDNRDIDSGKYALESTLQNTNNILVRIANAIDKDSNDALKDTSQDEDSLKNDDVSKLITELSGAVTELKNVANGIVDRQKLMDVDASERINTPDKRAYLSGVAASAVSDNLDNVSIEKIYAAADGLVGVSGAVKNAEGVWEGFALHINDANQAVKVSTKEHSTYAKKLNEEAAATQQAADAAKKASSAEKAANKGLSITAAQKKYDVLSNAAGRYISDDSDVYSSKVEAALERYTNAFKDLKIAKEAAANAKDGQIEEETRKFNVASDACKQYAQELENLLKQPMKFAGSHSDVVSISKDAYDVDDIESRKQALLDYVNTIYKGQAKIEGFDDSLNELNFTIKKTDGSLQSMKAEFDATGTAIGTAVGKVKKQTSLLGSLFGGIGKEMAKLSRYFIARFGIEEVIQVVRQGITYIKEIDDALTELKKVTNETDASYNRFLQTMSKTAGVVGSTVAELTTMAADWARLGYSMQQAADLAESTAILLNVSEFEDATQASEALISTIQAFGYAAEESMSVVDILNEVGFYEPRLYSNI